MSNPKSSGDNPLMALKDRTFVVHKQGEEGTITIHELTGRILTPPQDRPEWSAGLAAAMPQERITYYVSRLSDPAKPASGYTDVLQQIKDADAIAYEDLSWVAVDANQAAVEIEADPEFRSEALAKLLGIDTDEGTMGAGITAERELAQVGTRMTTEEAAAMEQAIAGGFTQADQETEAEKRQAKG